MRAIDLAEREARDPTAVGHKAVNLARFAAGYRVPPGFCLSTSVYDQLKSAMSPAGAVERATLRACVADAYERLAGVVRARDPLVAVRSSATGEDSADASFAGQHETILNVSGVDAVVDAVLECWRSAGNERVTAYRKEKGIDAPVQVAVLVQQMVDADVSAIAFGVDPVSGDDTVVVIDAAEGLGDKIAAGEITPDRYVVRKSDLSVGGPARGSLNEEQARDIGKLTLALERENAHPVDVECAFAKGVLYLLQCRPITTLAAAFPVRWAHPDDARLHWRRDDAHYDGPVPRLVNDYTKHGPAHGLRRRAEMLDQPILIRPQAFSGRSYTAQVRRDPTGDLATQQGGATARIRAYARGVADRWNAESLPALRAHYDWYAQRTADAVSLPRAALAEVWDESWTRFSQIWARGDIRAAHRRRHGRGPQAHAGSRAHVAAVRARPQRARAHPDKRGRSGAGDGDAGVPRDATRQPRQHERGLSRAGVARRSWAPSRGARPSSGWPAKRSRCAARPAHRGG